MSKDIRKVLNEHPDLPVIVLGESIGGGDFTYYYLSHVEADVEWLLFHEEAKLPGIGDDKIYNDEDEVRLRVAEGLCDEWEFEAMKHGMEYGGSLEEFCGMPGLTDMADKLAEAMTNAAPWKQYVVIEASA